MSTASDRNQNSPNPDSSNVSIPSQSEVSSIESQPIESQPIESQSMEAEPPIATLATNENFIDAIEAQRQEAAQALSDLPPDRALQFAQETLYQFLLAVVKKWPPEEVLLEFKRLFLYQVDASSSGAVQAVYQIVSQNDETEFRNTLKRCCYILVNNWDASRHYKPIQELIVLFHQTTPLDQQTISPTLKRLRDWIQNFSTSQDYEDLKLFAARYDEQRKAETSWTGRYTSYLLVPQFIDLANPIEQREAARALAKRLKDRFKFDLAMYIVKSQTATSHETMPQNPTALGENVLLLIKTIVAKRGQYSYANLAHLFLQQTRHLTYKDFKQSLQKYLIFSVERSEFAEILRARLDEKLETLYHDYHNEPITDALILRTCNRIIECLTTENRQDPSPLFVSLLSQGNPMTLVIVLLKLILICKNARTHLEARIAELIRHYETYPASDCKWVVNFLEIFNVAFTIYAENVQYNLVKMDEVNREASNAALQDYRIFAQMKRSTPLETLTEKSRELPPDSPIDPTE